MKPYKPDNGEELDKGKLMPLPCLQKSFCSESDGFQGIWAGQTPTNDEYVYKYSGGLGTYPVQSRPFSVYAPEVERTFFVWGGYSGNHSNYDPQSYFFGEGQLLHMIAFYDHNSGKVSRPRVLFDKWCADPHDNPVISIDGNGYIWIFSPSHGPWTTRSYVHRSRKPYAIEEFDLISAGMFAYPQPWWIAELGFAFFHTQYEQTNKGYFRRTPYFVASADGIHWSPPQKLGNIEQGHYQVTAAGSGVLGTAFDYHPAIGGLEARTNIYYLQTRDFGSTWENVQAETVDIPIENKNHPALVRDFEGEGIICYVKDLAFDCRGWPVIHYVAASSWKPGPEGGDRKWEVARWNGDKWCFSEVCRSDHNYDMGSLDLSEDGRWLLTGTSGKGPQAYNAGGEVELWESRDQGGSWTHVRRLTNGSRFNHNHVRRGLNAHPDFAVFWADGHAREASISSLYFSNREGDVIWRLPHIARAPLNEPVRVIY